jgi:hypothetical protein
VAVHFLAFVVAVLYLIAAFRDHVFHVPFTQAGPE